MKIRMLGTGYGECKIKKKFSRDLRGRGGVLVDEKLLIDCPSDIFSVADGMGFSDVFNDVCDVLISHSHEGHFSVESLMRLSEKKRIRVYATDQVLSLIPDVFEIEKIKISAFAPLEIGNFRILPLPSNHLTEIPGEEALNFIIIKDKTVFYALDGGSLNFEAWQVLKKIRIDCVIIECALESKDHTALNMIHNNVYDVSKIKKILISEGVCSQNTRFLLTHIPTDKKRSIHEELSLLSAESALTVTYDGYFTNI